MVNTKCKFYQHREMCRLTVNEYSYFLFNFTVWCAAMYEATSKCFSIKSKTSTKSPVHSICYFVLAIFSVQTTANWRHIKMEISKVSRICDCTAEIHEWHGIMFFFFFSH